MHGKIGDDLFLYFAEMFPRIIAAPDPRLIGRYNDRDARQIGATNDLGHALDQTDVLAPVQVIDFIHHDAVAIQKQCRTAKKLRSPPKGLRP